MPAFRKYFSDAIEKNFPASSNKLIAIVDDHYRIISADTAFAATSTNPIDKRLDFCAYFLALIKTLDQQGENFDTIKRICIGIVTKYVSPKNRFHRLLKRVPAKLVNTWLASAFLKVFAKRVSQNSNPSGFIASIITDKKETFGLGYGVDILECGICKLFHKHGYQKFSSILCEVDAITSDLAGLTLIRNSTIALGAKKCDFRWKKKNQF